MAIFERYTEKARRAIFFARFEAGKLGSLTIETEHLLLGVLREDSRLGRRVLGRDSLDVIRRRLKLATPVRVPDKVDMPLSLESRHVIAYTADEAKLLRAEHIGTGHMLLGLMRVENGTAAKILAERGVTLEAMRAEVASGDVSRKFTWAWHFSPVAGPVGPISAVRALRAVG